ncbi:MAG: TlyA family RNA methyltransferase [Pseudomonadota bacterium]
MRLDRALVAAGLAESRARAQALIAAGVVRVGGRPAEKASAEVADGAALEVTGNPNPWVSRAALKLVHALDHFGISTAGRVALDLGASTGGFTEVLLARGAAHVHAVDVGHGQLHPRLAGDPRVTLWEGVNARALPSALPRPGIVTADLSFISLTTALPPALVLAAPDADLIALIKPQFEAGKGAVGKGVVRDPEVQAEVRARIAAFLRDAGWSVTGQAESPIAGGDGNREFLIAARKPA